MHLLLDHFLGVNLPLADKLDVSSEPPLDVHDLPQVENFGIVSDLAESLKGLSDDKIAELKRNGGEQREDQEERGDGDTWYEKNRFLHQE